MRVRFAALAAVVVLAVVVDAAGTALLERAAAQRATEALDAPAAVELAGWPVTVRALAGSVPRVSVSATGVPLPDVGGMLSRVEATLTDVEVWALREAVGVTELPPAAGGHWAAELHGGDLQAALPDGAEARLSDGLVELEIGDLRLDATVTAEGGRLVVRPTAPLLQWARIEFGFEALPGAPTVEHAEVTASAVRMRGRLHPPPPGASAVR